MKYLIFTLPLVIFLKFGYSQTYTQYFDGADTVMYQSIFFEIDSSAENVWQVGPPQKTIFDSAASHPNVLVTDTIFHYPTDNHSWVILEIPDFAWGWGIVALQWKQKLDFEFQKDGGLVEYFDINDSTWKNAFTSPIVYNFFGYDSANVNTLPSGKTGFTGTDSAWKDIWLCFDLSVGGFGNSFLIRFSLETDSVKNPHEGWMIDNVLGHISIIHTVKIEDDKVLTVLPNLTDGPLEISLNTTLSESHIESIELVNLSGQVLEIFKGIGTQQQINISHYPSGMYYLRVKAGANQTTTGIVLQH